MDYDDFILDFYVLCPCCHQRMDEITDIEEEDLYYVCPICNYQSDYLRQLKKNGKCEFIKYYRKS